MAHDTSQCCPLIPLLGVSLLTRSSLDPFLTRLFMANAIESYLRGCPLHHHEFFVKRGLLEFLVHGLFDTGMLLRGCSLATATCLIEGPSTGSSFLQTSFDLLSELVKFSPVNLDRVET